MHVVASVTGEHGKTQARAYLRGTATKPRVEVPVARGFTMNFTPPTYRLVVKLLEHLNH